MPTAVLDLDLQQMSPTIIVPESDNHVLILIQSGGQPVGQVLLLLRPTNGKAIVTEAINPN